MRKEILISYLRDEAYNVKECFTQFSFQSLAISGAVIGLIIKFQNGCQIVSLSTLSITILLMLVAKIGNHKYNTANRNLGFILYMERMDSLFNRGARLEEERYSDLDSVPWEEAMRAWRIVQATVFTKVYTVDRLRPNTRKIECSNDCKIDNNPYCSEEEYWFEPTSIIRKLGKPSAIYYAGGYLEAVQIILFCMAFTSVLPLLISTVQYFREGNFIAFFAFMLLLIITIATILWRILRLNARRKILESGLLSIHSCGILWEAVMIAHKKAIEETIVDNSALNSQNHLYVSYTRKLSQIALELAGQICNIHNWIEQQRRNS